MVRSGILKDFECLGRNLGLDVTGLMARVGLDAQCLNDPGQMLPLAPVVELFEQAALSSNTSDFGLRLGETLDLPDLGPAILLLREEENVRAALHTLIDFVHLHCDAACLNLEEDGAHTLLTFSIIGCPNGSQTQAIDAGTAHITIFLRWLLGEQWSPEAACFAHARPASTLRYRNFFRCPVEFSHDFNGLMIAREDLERKLPNSSPVVRREMERYLKACSYAPHDSYAQRVSKIVAVEISLGRARADIVSRNLGITHRTLNRRLADANLNFSAILDDVRKNLSTQYLSEQGRRISDIAELVGFSSVSAFSTWFKHAFGCTARAWRKKQSTSGAANI